MKLSDLIEKYHWSSAPEVHDDLIALEQASQEYHIMATLVDRKHRRNACAVRRHVPGAHGEKRAHPRGIRAEAPRGISGRKSSKRQK